MQKILLIDLGSVYWQAWHSSVNEEVSAAHDRAVAQVRRVRDGFDLVAVCCDSPRSLRREKFPTYKANRPDKDVSALEQLRRVKETLTADGLLLWQADGYEADDVIAAATAAALTRDMEITIASSDKDLLQLVSDRVTVRSLKTDNVYRPADVQTRYGVAPAQMRDWLALVGDKSDNIAGVPGVGEKTAAELLTRFSSARGILEALVSGVPVSKPKIEESLRNHHEALSQAIELVTLRSDAPINFEQIFEKRELKPLVDAEWDEVESPAAEEVAVPNAQEAEAHPTASAGPAYEATVAGVRIAPQPKPSTALAKVDGGEGWSLALEPTSTRDAFMMAKALFNSRLYSNYPSAEAIFAVILRGRSLGLDATTALANFHVVEGKPTMSATLIRGLVLKSGKAEYFDLVETTEEQATYAAKRKGSAHEVKLTFTIKDAANAGLVTWSEKDREFHGVSRSGKPSNWDKWRRTMLRHRCAVELAREVFADVCAGLYTADEISEGRVIDVELAEAS
jgi:5'-3' exonuclease